MPPRRRQAATQTAEAYNYDSAERLNNPTSETALGMEPEDLADQPIPEMEEEEERVRHPRLQWNRGKQTDHSRTFGPLYIHDKVSPEQFLKTLTKTNPQRDMWALLNGLPKDAAAKPYEYSGHWTNRLIRATGQRAMASLLYKDGMRGKVNLIYMDPPYNKSFRSNFQASADTPETEEDWDDLPNDPVAIKAFRDTYRDGVHSYPEPHRGYGFISLSRSSLRQSVMAAMPKYLCCIFLSKGWTLRHDGCMSDETMMDIFLGLMLGKVGTLSEESSACIRSGVTGKDLRSVMQAEGEIYDHPLTVFVALHIVAIACLNDEEWQAVLPSQGYDPSVKGGGKVDHVGVSTA